MSTLEILLQLDGHKKLKNSLSSANQKLRINEAVNNAGDRDFTGQMLQVILSYSAAAAST